MVFLRQISFLTWPLYLVLCQKAEKFDDVPFSKDLEKADISLAAPTLSFFLSGLRPTNEDHYDVETNFLKRKGFAFFALFDGHCGAEAAKYAAKNLGACIAGKPNFVFDPH